MCFELCSINVFFSFFLSFFLSFFFFYLFISFSKSDGITHLFFSLGPFSCWTGSLSCVYVYMWEFCVLSGLICVCVCVCVYEDVSMVV